MVNLVARHVAAAFIVAWGVAIAAMIVSLGLGTTEFGWTPEMRARVQVIAEMLMWIGVAISVIHTTLDILIWLADKGKDQ